MISSGAVNTIAVGDDEKTALYYAIENGHEECARLLLIHRARMNVKLAGSGRTLLYEACSSGHLGCVELLLNRGSGRECLIDEVVEGRTGETGLL